MVMILISFNTFSYIPGIYTDYPEVAGLYNESLKNIFNNDDKIDLELSRLKAISVFDEFTSALYFADNLERESFTKHFMEFIDKEYFNLNPYINKSRIEDEYFLKNTELSLIATDILDTYNSLKTCQLNYFIPLDPLSTTVTSIITGSNIQSSLAMFNIESSFKFLVYSHYQQYLMREADKIYSARLLDCLQLPGTMIVSEKDKSEFTPQSLEIVNQKTAIVNPN